MNRSAQVAAVALLVVLLGHPLAAVCACWQGQAEPAAPTSGCHGDMAPGASVQGTTRDCCLVVPATPAPSQLLVQNSGALFLSLPNLQLAGAVETTEPAAESSESPPRSPDSSLQALYCVFLI